MYYIDWGYFCDDEEFPTMEEAMESADKQASYNQQNIKIKSSETGEIVAERVWYGVEYNEEDDQSDPITFGSFGFYGDWVC